MTHLKKLLLILLICVFAVADSFAGGNDRVGTNAAPELQIPVGSRYLGMAGSNISSSEGLESIYWNPAGVSITQSGANAIFNYRSYIADMKMEFAAVSGSFGGLGTIALAFRDLNIGQIPVTTTTQPDGTGELFSPTYFILGLTYSRALTDRVSVGATINIINESFGNVSSNGMSFDIGVQYRDLLDIQGLAVGVVVKNLGGSMTYDGSALWVQASNPSSFDRGQTFYKVGAASFDLPSEISLGISYTRKFDEDNTLSGSFAFTNNNYAYDEYKLGFEYSYKSMLYARVGFLKSPEASPYEDPNIFAGGPNSIPTPYWGFGLNFKNFTDMDISLDYAHVPVQFFDSNNSVTVRFGF
jgi:hypothetical protein